MESAPIAAANSTPTLIPATATTQPTGTPKPEPTKTIAELSYAVKVGKIECALAQHSDEFPDVFLAECSEIIYMRLYSTIEIELITPNGESYGLVDTDDILADFATSAIPGEFVSTEELNKAGCAIPNKDKAGEIDSSISGKRAFCKRYWRHIRFSTSGNL